MKRTKIFRIYLCLALLLAMAQHAAWAADATKPGTATIDEMSFPNGEYVGKVVFTMPTKTDGGANISEQLSYRLYVGTSYASLTNTQNQFLIQDGSASAGETITVDGINIKDYYPTRDNFSVTFTVYAFNSVGNSFKYSAVFVGYARPSIPTNVKAAVNPDTREVTLTWDAPSGPNNVNQGGYIDYDNLTYTIVRYPGELTNWAYGTRYDPIEVATDRPGTTYTETLPDAPYEGYCYRITAINHGETSVPYYGYSDTIKVGRPWTIPYLDTFEDAYFMNRYEWTVSKSGNVTDSWTFSNGIIMTRGASDVSVDGDHWLISPPITMEKGKLYEASLQARLSAKRTHGTLTFAVGQGLDPTTYTDIATEVNVPWIDEYTYTKVGGTYTVPETGVYRLALHDVTSRLSNSYNLICDSLRIDFLSSTAAPDSVSNFRVVPGERGALTADISFNAPATDTEGEPLSALTRIDVIRTVGDVETLIQSINTPTPGAAYTAKDTKTNHGQNTYTVRVYNTAGKGLENTKSLFIGPDVPQPLTNVVLKDLLDDRQRIKLTWDPVSETGLNGGYVDPEKVKYNIYIRGDNASAPGSLQTTVTKNELTIEGVKVAQGDPSFMWYYVEAVNDEGSTPLQYSNTLVCGEPYPLPFIEGYPNGMAQYYWWYGLERPDDYDNENGYAFTLDGYHGYGKEMGCASWKSNNDGEKGTLRSCKIAMPGVVHPEMEMWIRYEGTVQPDISIEIDDQATHGLKTAYTFDGILVSGDKKWTHIIVDLSEYRDAPYILMNIAVTTPKMGTVIYVDDIRVYDLLDYDIETTIANTLTSVKTNTPTVFNVHAKNLGIRSNNRYTMNLYANGRLVDSKPGKELETLQDSVFQMTYTPLVTDAGEIELYAEVAWSPYDLNEENDRSQIIDLRVLSSDYAPIDDLKAETGNDNKVTLSWTTPENAVTVFDDFESYTAWNEPFGKWTTVDGDGIINFVPGTWTFPYMDMAYGWALFDITDVTSPIGSSLTTQSGNQCAVSMSTAMSTATKVYPPCDDWLISPLLSGRAQTLSFYVRDYSSSSYQSKMAVYASTTGKATEDFTLVKDYPKGMIPGQWTEQRINLPEGTKYFAIRSTSQNSFCVLVDDVTYEAGGGDILGYNVYRDGELLTTVSNTTATGTTVSDDGNSHDYQVSIIYSEGESPLSNTATTTATGIETVADSESIEVSRYSISGQQLTVPQRGINIVRTADGKAHKVVVKE